MAGIYAVLYDRGMLNPVDLFVLTFEQRGDLIVRLWQQIALLGVNMRAWNSLLFCSLLAVASGCTPATSVSPPFGWVQIDAREFSFYVPPDVKAVPVQGIDSFVGEYNGDSISLNFDYGHYSDPLDYKERTNYIAHDERIDDKKARVVSYDNPGSGHPFDYAIGIHFPEVNGKDIRLTVYATCKTTNDYETARTVFRTIKFR